MKTSSIIALAFLTLSAAAGCSAADRDNDVATGSDAITDAAQSNPVTLSTVSYAGGTLDFGYTVTGGCAEHSAKANLVNLRNGEIMHEGRLEVLDVSASDSCEALIGIEGKAKLLDLLAAADPEATTAAITLPTVGLELSESSREAEPQPAGAGNPMHLTQASLERDGTFSFGYSTPGGCADHAPKVSIELRPSESFVFSHTAKVIVSDVPATPDSCEAMIGVDGRVNLSALIRAEAQRTGADVRSVEVELPPVEVSRY